MKFIFFLFGFFFCIKSNAQNVYYLNSNYETVTHKKDATFFVEIVKIEDSIFQYNYYALNTLLLHKVETYTNKNGDILQGFVGYYNNNGHLDSCGFVKNFKKNDFWRYYNAYALKPDSIIKLEKYENGKLYNPDNFMEQNSPFGFKVEKYNGKFLKFLENNLKYPPEAIKMQSEGMVTIQFQVEEDGIASNFNIMQSRNYFLDKEALRVIQLSKANWIPKKIAGKTVKSYHIQSINFTLR